MIYLDHASTSYPKPREVVDAVREWYETIGVSADRGAGSRCRAVASVVHDVRERLARMCGTSSARVAFSSGATESINLFLRAVVGRGGAVLTTAVEHSSVARPLVALRDRLGIDLEVLPCDPDGRVDHDLACRTLGERRFDLFLICHASNVTGAVQQVTPMFEAARAAGTLSLLDASQTAGLLDLDVGADAVVASAHKGLMGPPGLGFLAVRAELAPAPQKQGGTGSSRALDRHPVEWPAAFEAGTPNTPAIYGLGAALGWRAARDSSLDLSRGLAQLVALRDRLLADGARVIGHGDDDRPRVPILSVVPRGLDPAEAGIALDEADIHVRTGYHCAPWIHDHLGTAAAGTVRISPGPFVTADEVLEVSKVLAR